MNLTLEKKILGYMLNNIDEAKRTPLEAYWFIDKAHRELATTLLNSDKEFTDFSQLEYEVKVNYPKSSVTEEWMHLIKFEEMFIDDLKESVKSLEKEYIQDKTNQATMTYLEQPTPDNKEKLEDWLRRLDEADVEEDNGELGGTIAEILNEFEHGVRGGLKSYNRLDKVLGNGLEGGMMFILAGRPGTGKGHPNWLEIPTPSGNRKFGDLEVGDYVFDRFGKPTKVTGVYPRGLLETYRVTLNDGRSTIVDGDHIWSYYNSGGKLITKTTKEMYDGGTHNHKKKPNGKVGRHAKYAIPTNEPVHFKGKQHSVDPYVIGALIGDGALLERALTISSNDEEVVERVAELLNTTPRKQHKNNYSWQFELKEPFGRRKLLHTKDVLADFPEVVAYSHLKEIPEEYFFTGLESRMRLLNGLFDTDGSAVRTGKRLNVSYSTTSEKLAEQIRWLLQSCGYLSGLALDEREGRNTTYNINVLGQAEKTKELFTLPRKKEIVESYDRKKSRNYDRIQINKIEKTGSLEEITCISVENEEQLYLTNDFIVTHNTAYAINMAVEMLIKQPDVQIDFFTLEMTKVAMAKRFISRLTGINSYKFKDTKRLLKDDEKREVIEKMEWLNGTGLRIHDSKSKLSDIERAIRQRKHESKDKDYIAFIDYIGLVKVGGSLDRYLEVGKISRTFKLLTNELNIPLVVLSQLNRGVESRQDKKPVLSDLRESGDLEQDANVVGLLSEDLEIDHLINLDIAKNREGMLATIPYEFYKPATTFREMDANG